MSKDELRVEWEKRIAEFRASGQSGTQWCALNQINIHKFRYWVRKLQMENQLDSDSSEAVKWLSVKVDGSPVQEDNSLTIQVGRASIQIKSGFNPTLLKQVVQALADA